MQSFGIGTTLGSSLAKQHDTIVVPERQRALEQDTNWVKNNQGFSQDEIKLE